MTQNEIRQLYDYDELTDLEMLKVIVANTKNRYHNLQIDGSVAVSFLMVR